MGNSSKWFNYGNIWCCTTSERNCEFTSNIPNYTSNDYAYGAGFLSEKLLEAVVLRKVLQVNGSWSGFSHNTNNNLKFSLKIYWPKDNFMIRLERGHRSPWSNTTTPYFGQPYNGFNTHINIDKFGS